MKKLGNGFLVIDVAKIFKAIVTLIIIIAICVVATKFNECHFDIEYRDVKTSVDLSR